MRGKKTMNLTEPAQTPRWILWTVLVCFTGLLSFASAEITLRIIPGPWSGAFFHRYDPDLGTWHFSSFSGKNVSADYTTLVSFNSFGMRDRERTVGKSGRMRIAVLGDSFVEGLQVADSETFTRQMEELFDEQVEVLNFGVGGFGTTQAYETYLKKVRPFRPDMVILAFLSANDMRNNSRELELLYNGGTERKMPFPEKGTDGKWSITPVPEKSSAQNPIVLFLKRYLVLYRFLWFEKAKLVAVFSEAPKNKPLSASTTASENMSVYLSRLFVPPQKESLHFQEAWEATDWVIGELQATTEADGARFVLVTLPDVVHISPDPRTMLEKEYGQTLPNAFDIDYPEKHLALLARERGFLFLDLTPAFRAYRDVHQLTSPYFSFPHDGHWSPRGHELAAKTIVSYLKDNYLVP